MRKVLGGLLLASSMLAPFAAHAAKINDTTAINFVDNTATLGGQFTAAQSGKTFADNYTFTVGSSFDVSSAVISISAGSSSNLKLSGLTLTGNGTTYDGDKLLSKNTTIDAWELQLSGLAAGSYTLTVTGKVLGSSGGSYGGNINIASAVPEADTYALMLAGLALVGGIAYRRKIVISKQAPATFALCA